MPNNTEMLEYARARFQHEAGPHFVINSLVVPLATTIPAGLLFPKTFSSAVEATALALAQTQPQTLDHIDLTHLADQFSLLDTPDFFHWVHSPNISTAMTVLDWWAKSTTFPDSTVYDHDSLSISLVAGLHNLLNRRSRERTKLALVGKTTQDIIRGISFYISSVSAYTIPTVFETLQVIASGIEVDNSAIVPGLLGLISMINCAYNIVILGVSLAQYWQRPIIPDANKNMPDLPALPQPTEPPQLPPPVVYEYKPFVRGPRKPRKSLLSPNSHPSTPNLPDPGEQYRLTDHKHPKT